MKIEQVEEAYLKLSDFNKIKETFAPAGKVDELKKTVDRCAKLQKMMALFDQNEKRLSDITNRLNSDFATNDVVNEKIKNLNMGMNMNYLQKEEFMHVKKNNNERYKELKDAQSGFEIAVKNHTNTL